MANINVTGPGNRAADYEEERQRKLWDQRFNGQDYNTWDWENNPTTTSNTGGSTSGSNLGAANVIKSGVTTVSSGSGITGVSNLRPGGGSSTGGTSTDLTQSQKDAQTRAAAQTALRRLMQPIPEDPNARIAKERQLQAQAGQARLQTKGQYSRAGMGTSGAAGYGQAAASMAATQGVGRGMEQFDRARRMEEQQRQFAAAGLSPVVGRLGMEQEAFDRAMKELRQQQIDIAGDVGDVLEFTSGSQKLNATIVASKNDIPMDQQFQKDETRADGSKFRVVKSTADNKYYAYPLY